MAGIRRIISNLNRPYVYAIGFGVMGARVQVEGFDVLLNRIEDVTVKKASQNRDVTELIGGNPTGGRLGGVTIPHIWFFWRPITRYAILSGPDGTKKCRVKLQRRGSFLTSFGPREWEIVAVEPYPPPPGSDDMRGPHLTFVIGGKSEQTPSAQDQSTTNELLD